jgi:hypothetical protein
MHSFQHSIARYLTVLLVALMLPLAALAQESYVVVYVKGTIVRKSNGLAIKRGDRMSPTEAVKFSTPDAVASLVSPKGRFLLKATSSGARGATGSEAYAILKDNVLAERPAQRLSSRAAGLLSQADIARYVAGTADGTVKPILIFDPWLMQPAPMTFPLAEQRFFFIRYTYRGEVINKKLPQQDASVMVTAADLYKIDNKPIDPAEVRNHELYYTKDGAVTTIGALEPVFADAETRESVRLMLESLHSAGYDNTRVYDELVSFLTDYVATPLDDNLKAYLKATHSFEVK